LPTRPPGLPPAAQGHGSGVDTEGVTRLGPRGGLAGRAWADGARWYLPLVSFRRAPASSHAGEEGFGLLEVVLAMAVIAGASALGAGVALVTGQATAASAQRLEATEILSTVLASGSSSASVQALGTTYVVTVQTSSAPNGTVLATGTVTWSGPGGTTNTVRLTRDERPSPEGGAPLVVGEGAG
jgi:type II secretory pathway pseudopilin PulG